MHQDQHRLAHKNILPNCNVQYSKQPNATEQHKTTHCISLLCRHKNKEAKIMAKKTEEIVLQDVAGSTKFATIIIEGTSDLVLNRMNARTIRQLTAERNDKSTKLQAPNIWEDVITAIHWRDGFEMEDTYEESSEEKMHEMLQHNAPCFTAFGLKKSLDAAVVRYGIDTYATKFDASLIIPAPQGLIPITFSQWFLDERLMSPKKGSPVLARLSHFSGWGARVPVEYIDAIYGIERITDVFNKAGFGLGVGSGRTSDYGRFRVVGVE